MRGKECHELSEVAELHEWVAWQLKGRENGREIAWTREYEIHSMSVNACAGIRMSNCICAHVYMCVCLCTCVCLCVCAHLIYHLSIYTGAEKLISAASQPHPIREKGVQFKEYSGFGFPEAGRCSMQQRPGKSCDCTGSKPICFCHYILYGWLSVYHSYLPRPFVLARSLPQHGVDATLEAAVYWS